MRLGGLWIDRAIIGEAIHKSASSTAAHGQTRLMCFSGTGFTDDLHKTAAHDPTVQLIDLNRLYHGE